MRRRSSLARWRPRLRARPGSTRASCSVGGSSCAVLAQAAPAFAPVAVAPESGGRGCRADAGLIEIEFASGRADADHGPVDPSTVSAMITALAKAGRAAMIPLPSGVQVWLATGHTDMRKGFDGLALLVQETLKRNPHSGHLFVFRGRRGGLIKVLWHDGQGMCLFAKRLERGRFVWPSTARTARMAVTITPAQLGYLLEGIDWRLPQRTWRPTGGRLSATL